MHDLAFERLPDHFDAGYRRWAAAAHRAAARRAAAVICVSATTARDVRSRWGVPEHRIVVAHHGLGQEPAPARHGPRDQDLHFLYVGDAEPRKNLAALLAAHRLYREATPEGEALPLVLAGTGGSGAAGGRNRAGGSGTAGSLASGVRLEPRPTAERLARLYARAAALVHPALHEGFGLTPLEAMSTGTPVIASRAPGVVEICGDAAHYVDPRDPRELARALAALAADVQTRRDLAERGRRRAAEFSWARSARAHLRAYELAVADFAPA